MCYQNYFPRREQKNQKKRQKAKYALHRERLQSSNSVYIFEMFILERKEELMDTQ